MNRHNDRSAGYSDVESGSGSAHEFERGHGGPTARRKSSATRMPSMAAPAADEKPKFSFDPGSLLRPASKRWYWLVLAGAVGAVLGAMLGTSMWKTGYSASAQLMRYDPPVASKAYQPPQMTGGTVVGLMSSPQVFERMGQKMKPPVPGGALKHRIVPKPERGSDLVNVEAFGSDPRSAVDLANAYIDEVIDFSKYQQTKDAEEAMGYVTQTLKEIESDLALAQKELPADLVSAAIAGTSDVSAGNKAPPPGAAAGVSPAVLARQLEQIQAAETELQDLLLKYHDIHPSVKAQRAKVAELKSRLPGGMTPEQIAATTQAASGSLSGAAGSSAIGGAAGVGLTQQLETSYYKVRTLELQRLDLLHRQRAIMMFRDNPPGNWRKVQPASMDTLGVHKPGVKVAVMAILFGLLGFVAAGVEVLRREIFDNRLKTEGDVERVTGLPVLGTLGDIRGMSLAQRESWAFRTWIALQDRLAYSPNHGLICGVTSSNPGDGRTTWINLLAGAARKCGFRVLTIATRSTSDIPGFSEESADTAAQPIVVGAPVSNEEVYATAGAVNGAASMNGSNGHSNSATATAEPVARAHVNGVARTSNGTTAILSNPADLAKASRTFAGDSEFTALTASALFTPAMVTEKLMGPETDPLVHIPLPGWTWNLERRKQWQGALNVWRKIDNVVILVELPPASMPESVLLASNLPNLLWLVESGKSEATETRNQLQTLRHARCNLVGAVINRALTPVTQGRFSRWVGCFAMFALLGLGLSGNGLVAAEAVQSPAIAAAEVPPAAMSAAFSVVSPNQRAQWQQKLTLGPGDVLNLSLYGEPQLDANEVPVGPDGRVNYLEAQGVMASGLTVDEFRERLNEALGKFRRSPQAIVVPVSYKSKKYFVLGRVMQRGAFPLDRPITLLEAVGRAGGMETGMSQDRSTIELADLSQAFVARGGRHLPVNFERLFQEGDLTQNITLEPNDYIYFPGADQKEVFVLGAVTTPGAYQYTQKTGALGAIAARGGFAPRAWQGKVLVIRGGLNKPQTFEISAHEVLSAQKPDVQLQPKDIVFVSERPWARVEEILDLAAQAFVTSATVTITTERVEGLR
jgi:protein involved in polysaccharide export with SLBB domain/capsular polysaccharide biosynthesis protein